MAKSKRIRWGVKDKRDGAIFGPWASRRRAANYCASRNQSLATKPFKVAKWLDDMSGPNLPGYARDLPPADRNF